MEELLKLNNLSVCFHTPQGDIHAVRNVSFSLHPKEILAIVGESGCGKSTLCKCILKLLPNTAEITGGTITANGVDITRYHEKQMQKLRGKLFSIVLQDPLAALNPSIPVGRQITEAVRIHHPYMTKQEIRKRVLDLMRLTGMPDPDAQYTKYPHHLSGGMRQRSVLAAALASGPNILLADEPTTALDVTIQAQILDLLQKIQKQTHTAMLLVTHDLGVVARIADRVAIMYAGKIVEIGTAEEIFYKPRHPYTWGLLRALPYYAKENETLCPIPGMPPNLLHPPKGDAFACRNAYAMAIDYEQAPPMFQLSDTHFAATWLLDKRAPAVRPLVADSRLRMSTPFMDYNDILLDVHRLSYDFHIGNKQVVHALDNVSFQICKGEIFGLVGESGCGKSTVARCIMNIYHPLSGAVYYKGINTCDRAQRRQHKRLLQTTRQIIFQDSSSSLNPHMKVADIIAEPLAISRKAPPHGSLRAEAQFQLGRTGMDVSYLDYYPPALSGGMRQRVAIARALAMEPELLIADEPTASLDVSVQAQILNLFKHLQKEHGFSFLFIAHDLSAVRYLCDRVGVMYRGRIVEIAPVKELFEHPLHPYTKALLSAIPVPDPTHGRKQPPHAFQPADAFPDGDLRPISPEHFVSCQNLECPSLC